MHDEPTGGNIARALDSADPETANPHAGVVGGTAGEADDAEDISEAARAAINYLMVHDPVVTVTFPEGDPPSEEMLRLLAPHMVGIEKDAAELVGRYLTQQLAAHLGLGGIELA
jgi:hypothetical protein